MWLNRQMNVNRFQNSFAIIRKMKNKYSSLYFNNNQPKIFWVYFCIALEEVYVCVIAINLSR